jgi:hypothetical protein
MFSPCQGARNRSDAHIQFVYIESTKMGTQTVQRSSAKQCACAAHFFSMLNKYWGHGALPGRCTVSTLACAAQMRLHRRCSNFLLLLYYYSVTPPQRPYTIL